MLRDRTLAVTATTGTGDVTPGAAVTGFRSWAGAAAGSYSYFIEDGSAWETGRGAWDGTKLVRSMAASSTGSLLALSGTALIGIDFLAADNVGDWPVFVQRYSGASIPLATFTAFTFGNTAINLGGGSYDPYTGIYTVPQAGVYECQVRFRFRDGSGANINWGLGVDTASTDGPGFLWAGTTGASRNAALNNRLLQLSAGDQLRAFTYHEFGNGGTPSNYGAGEFTAVRVR